MTYPRFSYYTLHAMSAVSVTRVYYSLGRCSTPPLEGRSGRLCSNPPTEATRCTAQ